jgi:DNA-binding transcriptional MerR regulator
MPNNKVYTTGEVARKLGVHKNTIFYWLHTGKAKEPKRDNLFNGRIWTEKDLQELKGLKRVRKVCFLSKLC